MRGYGTAEEVGREILAMREENPTLTASQRADILAIQRPGFVAAPSRNGHARVVSSDALRKTFP